MNRYKFRGKCKTTREFYHGDLIQSERGTFIRFDSNENDDEPNTSLMVEVDPKTVGQCTGLKDKNGVEIWEGDIVHQTYFKVVGNAYVGDEESFEGYHVGQVVITATKGTCLKNPSRYEEETGETIATNLYKVVAGYRSEVIGNIHEGEDNNDT